MCAMSISNPGNLPQSPNMPEPAWEIAQLFPAQGAWSESDYLELKTNRLVEFSHGTVEVLAMPTEVHQFIVLFLCNALRAFVRPTKLGKTLLAPFRVRLWEDKIRQPDVMFMRRENFARTSNEIWDGADLVMEVVSRDDSRRDWEIKRAEYAQAGISEYWIVDPQRRIVTVLKLSGQQYEVHGEFRESERATSVLLPGFSGDVSEIFAAGDEA